jgi:cell division protein FtsX
MKRNFFLIGLCVAVAITATLAIHKYLTRNHNQVTESAAIQPEPATTTQNQASEEPAPVAQVQETATNVVEITFSPKFTFATSSSVSTNGSK